MARKKKITRRTKPKFTRRVSLGLRVSPELKMQLDLAAGQSGRSQSTEAAERLKRSFDREEFLSQMLSATYGSPLAGHALALALIMLNAGLHEYAERSDFSIDDRWVDDPTAFDQAVQGALAWLNAARPPGQVLESKNSPGSNFANWMIDAVKRDTSQDDPLGPRHLGMIRSLLGPLARRMTAETPRPNKDDARRMAEQVVSKSPQVGVSIVNEQRQRLVPILTLDQAIEVAAFRWKPSKWGDANVALAHCACGSRAFALEVFNSDEADTFGVGDLLILDPDERPAHGNWVLAKIDHRAMLGQYRVGERDAILAMSPDERANLREQFEQLLKETTRGHADSDSIAAKTETLRKAHKLNVGDMLLTNNLARKHVVERRPGNLPSNICAVVMEHTKIQSVRQPEAFADPSQNPLRARRA